MVWQSFHTIVWHVFTLAGAGAHAGCAYCTQIGEYAKCLQKVIYPGNRCYLPKNDILRYDKQSLSKQGTDFRPPPDTKTMKFIDAANDKYLRTTSRQELTDLVQTTGCKGPYALRKVLYHDCILNTPDPMHLINNIAEHCINLISSSSDSYKVREQEKIENRFKSCWIKNLSAGLPPAPFVLNKEEIIIADERARSTS